MAQAPAERTEILLASGDRLAVTAAIADVEKTLSDAARSGQARLAWFTETDSDRLLGINPSHVAALRGGPDTG